MQKTTAEKLTDIFRPMLDENGCITLPEAERLVGEAEFDMSEIGFDDLTELLEELKGQFTLDTTAEPPTFRCLLAQGQKTGRAATGLTAKEKNHLKFRFIKTIEFLSKKNPKLKGRIPLEMLEKQLKYIGVTDYGNMSLSDIIRLYPDKFELTEIGGTSCARLVSPQMKRLPGMSAGEKRTLAIPEDLKSPTTETVRPETAEAQPTQPATQPAAVRPISLYKLHDFAFFPDYRKALTQLARMSEADGWFILEDNTEPDPYYLVDLKLRSNFAVAMKRQLNGEEAGIRTTLTTAEVDTGFHTPQGKAVIAHFGVNKTRSTEACQSWFFIYFSEEGTDAEAVSIDAEAEDDSVGLEDINIDLEDFNIDPEDFNDVPKKTPEKV